MVYIGWAEDRLADYVTCGQVSMEVWLMNKVHVSVQLANYCCQGFL